jgi:hypothetical protein
MTTTIAIGTTWSNGSYRIHRYASSLRVTDIRNAGQRGKRCQRLSVWDDMIANHEHLADMLSGVLVAAAMCDAGISEMAQACADAALTGYAVTELRGVDVEPAELSVTGKHVRVTATDLEVCIRDLDDAANEPTAITNKRSDAKKLNSWIGRNLVRVDGLRFSELVNVVRSECGITLHQWCAID